jgi:hypothetical protein
MTAGRYPHACGVHGDRATVWSTADATATAGEPPGGQLLSRELREEFSLPRIRHGGNEAIPLRG